MKFAESVEEMREELKRITEIAEMRLERAGWHHRHMNRLEARVHALECQLRGLDVEPVKPREG